MAERAAQPRTHGYSRDLTQGPITRSLLMFALPTLGSNVIHALNGSINAVWVGRLLGEVALGATANGGLLLFFLLSAVFGFGMALTIIIAQFIGRNNLDDARRAVGTGVSLFGLLGVLIAGAGLYFATDLLRLMKTPEEVLPLALSYIRVIFIGMSPLYLFIFMGMAMRGSGDSRTPFMFILLSAFLDVTLNPILILGLFGLPRLGIAGSAWSMVISQIIGMSCMLAYIYVKKLPLRLRRHELSYLLPNPRLLKMIIGKGVPMGLQVTVMSLSALVMIYFVNQHGVMATAAYGVISQVWAYIQMPAMAVGAAVSAMAAQNIGAGLWNRIDRITRAGVLINIVMTGAFVAVILLLERPIIALFLPNDNGAALLAGHINHIATWGFILFGVSMTLFATVRATGSVIWPLIIMTIALFPGRIGFVLLAEPAMGANAIWWSFPVGSAAVMLLSYMYYRHGGWKKSVLTGRPALDADEAEDYALLSAEGAGQPAPPI